MRYIGLLRAVNVGGKNTIPMADLRSALAALDLQQVQTYIQTGNIVFDSDQTEAVLRQAIEQRIEQRFGFHVDVVLRTFAEFDRLVAHCPFGVQAGLASSSSVPAGLAVAFLDGPPNPDAAATLARYASPEEQYQVVGRDVYLFLPQGTARSKLVTKVQKLGPVATLRNWKTVRKLHALALTDQKKQD